MDRACLERLLLEEGGLPVAGGLGGGSLGCEEEGGVRHAALVAEIFNKKEKRVAP